MDLTIFNYIHGFAGRFAIGDLIGVFFADKMAYLMVLAVIILFFKQKGWKNKYYFFAITAVSTILSRGLITETFRYFYQHPRPFDALGFTSLIPESGNSFPSGHMTFYFALALCVWFVNRQWGKWFLGLTAVMGVARIFVGVHWPSDILGGAIIGLLCAWLVYVIVPKPVKIEDFVEEERTLSI